MHEVRLPSFALGHYEVLFEEYDLFAEATGRSRPVDRNWGRGGHPVLTVSCGRTRRPRDHRVGAGLGSGGQALVDFDKLRKKGKKPAVIEPREIFRRLPKPDGINDLYVSQTEVLDAWFRRRTDRDVVIKLHTGGGKTLVGLLACQSTLNEEKEPVMYLVPTKQLVGQTIERAKSYGLPAVEYGGQSLPSTFVNSQATLVATYSALFHGFHNKFGLRGQGPPVHVGAIVLDDAHVAFSVVRAAFTIEVDAKDAQEQYQNLAGVFRHALDQAGQLGTFDDIARGEDPTVLEVPYWAWRENMQVVRDCLASDSDPHKFAWPLIRDRLHMCHMLVSRSGFTITPILPLVDMLPTLTDATRRIYMSATIADDSEIVRTFDADAELVAKALTSRSVAGISERMILVPGLMPFEFHEKADAARLMGWVAQKPAGVVMLVPSNAAAQEWKDHAKVVEGSNQVDKEVAQLQAGEVSGPVVFANRYDGIDLPGSCCRLLVMCGLPQGTSSYDLFRAALLYGGKSMARLLAQRVEQGIGRGARGSGDYCVVLLLGNDLSGWVAKDANFRFLTAATRAQLDMGIDVSRAVENAKDLTKTMALSLRRDSEWTTYHAETLAEALDQQEPAVEQQLELSAMERTALTFWSGGYHEKAVGCIEAYLDKETELDKQMRGWLQQMAARIADDWGQNERADNLQRGAYANNRNLIRSKVRPAHVQLHPPGKQEQAIVDRMSDYRIRRGYLNGYDTLVSKLTRNTSSNQFEQSLMELGQVLGFNAERLDDHGVGPDVLWLLPGKNAIVFEARSRKRERNAFNKDDHGQLLVAGTWFVQHYPDHEYVLASVLAMNKATKPAMAGRSNSRALTYENLSRLIAECRKLLADLTSRKVDGESLVVECATLLEESDLGANRIADSYLVQFVEAG